MVTTIAEQQVADLLAGTCRDPHAFLGLHPGTDGQGRERLVARVWAPAAEAVTLTESGGRGASAELERAHPAGLFEAVLPDRREWFPYTLRMSGGGLAWETGDPYRFLPTVREQDLHYFGEGAHRRLYDVLGAHPRSVDGVAGVAFAVWAPNARGVSLCGDFNGWNRRSHPMRSLGPSGVWELFVPGLRAGERYKYALRGADGWEHEKADPFAFATELRPRTASVVADIHAHEWEDSEWMARRRERQPLREPMSVYEVHLGSWRRHKDGSWLTYRELAEQLAPYCREHNFTHVELLPVAEHPYDGSWGYQVTGFYAPTARFGSPADFQEFVDRFHREGVGVIVDWVPAHFAVDPWALARFDGTYLYEHEDPRRRFQPDWGTYTFNYGRHEVRNFLTANALFWLREYHVDALRVDGVSSMLYLDYSRKEGEWTPNRFGGRENLEAIEFLREANTLVYAEGEGAITIAEESTAWPGVSRPVYGGGLGFGFKWNMGWMHDTLDYFGHDPIYRQYHHNLLTFSMVYAYNENFVLALSHDEVVHGKGSLLHKMPGDEWRMFANLRLLHAYQHAHPGKKLIFMGMEFGQRNEWDHRSSVEWQALSYAPHAQVLDLVTELNRLHRAEAALHEQDHEPEGFGWLDLHDAPNSVLSWVRRARDGGYVVCVFNFTPVPRYSYRIPVPEPVRLREILNTDAREYGGSGLGNLGQVQAERVEHNGRPCSVVLTLPPLAALYLKPERDTYRVQP
jgi:1,4-alpha-glucan branching enzyme